LGKIVGLLTKTKSANLQPFKLKILLPKMKLSFALILLSVCTADARLLANRGNGNGQGNANGQGIANANGPPDFLSNDQLPPGLVDNPSGVVGVDFKAGKAPRAQKMYGKPSEGLNIRGLDQKAIKLDTTTAERINVFHPDQYQQSEDGTYVTDIETGEIIPLTVFYSSDDENGNDITFAVDSDGSLMNARVAPKMKDETETNVLSRIQNFQRLDGTDTLVGYLDDDIDLSNAPKMADQAVQGVAPVLPDDILAFLEQKKNGDGGTRRAQATNPTTHYGKTCNTWDYLVVDIVTDKLFKNRYSNHYGQTQAIFNEARSIYWKESCVYLWISNYDNTDGNSAWTHPSWNLQFDTYTQNYMVYSGCTSNYGALNFLKDMCKARFSSYNRDAWHLFTGKQFVDSGTVGCAYTGCKKSDWSYGVNNMLWSTNVRLQGVLFAHELGHNLGLEHLTTTDGYWVMEPTINSAPLDLTNTNAAKTYQTVVGSSTCGWY